MDKYATWSRVPHSLPARANWGSLIDCSIVKDLSYKSTGLRQAGYAVLCNSVAFKESLKPYGLKPYG